MTVNCELDGLGGLDLIDRVFPVRIWVPDWDASFRAVASSNVDEVLRCAKSRVIQAAGNDRIARFLADGSRQEPGTWCFETPSAVWCFSTGGAEDLSYRVLHGISLV